MIPLSLAQIARPVTDPGQVSDTSLANQSTMP